VSYLRQPPFNVEYFQIWNEAHPESGFYNGGYETYFTRLHNPAAKIIKELGGKVVYGGWPCGGSLDEYIAELDRYNAWKNLDVIDVHYFPVSAWEVLYKAAKTRGYGNIGIWQTEVAFTGNFSFVPNTYPRFMRWALEHGLTDDPDRYKLFFFGYWSPDDPKAYGYGMSLKSGEKLSGHGVALKTFGDLMKGRNMKNFDAFKTEPDTGTKVNLKFYLDERLSSIEGFEFDDHIVLAVHLSENNDARLMTEWAKGMNTLHLDAGDPTLSVVLPGLKKENIGECFRVSMAGERLPLTVEPANEKKPENGISLDVAIREPENSLARKYCDKASVKTFYILINKKQP